jgi:lipopolysaccharide export system permease protein
MQFLILQIDKLIGKDIPIIVILELIFTNLAYMVVLAAPMAVLVATLMAFGKFSELNELTALRASGINPISIIRPVLIAASIMFVFLAWFSNYVLPEANNKARSLFIDIRLKKPGFELQPNVFYDGIEGYTFLVKHIDSKTDSLYDITLFQDPNTTRRRVHIKAERGFLNSEGEQGLTLMLEEGAIHRELKKNSVTRADNMELTYFDKYRITFDLSDLEFSRSDPTQRGRSDRTMTAQAMAVVVDTLDLEIRNYIKESTAFNSFKSTSTIDSTQEVQIVNKSVFTPDTSETAIEVLPESEYVALNSVDYRSHRLRMLNVGVNRVEELQSRFENNQSNILWRTKRINKFLVEIYKKLSIPFACIVFVLLGAPLGIMTKKGNLGYAAIISSVILTIYWIAIIQGEKLADRLFISPFVGMWAFNIVFSIIGIGLLVHLTTDLNIRLLARKDD